MQIRRVEDKDIAEISRWFQSIQWDLPAVERALPKDGYVAENDAGVLIACAWLYVTGSSVSFVQWTNTNPDVKDQEQSDGLSLIIKTIQEMAPKLNPPINSLCIYTKNEKFKEKLKQLDFRSNFGFYQNTWVAKNESKSSKV